MVQIMSELKLAGVVTGSDIKPDDSLMVNQVTNTHSNFNAARAGGTGSSFASASNSVIVSTYLDGSDYIEFYVQHNVGSSTNAESDVHNTYACGFLIG